MADHCPIGVNMRFNEFKEDTFSSGSLLDKVLPSTADSKTSSVSSIAPTSDKPSSDVKPSSDTKTSVKGNSVIIGNQKRTGGTISWRTNNPGNVMYGQFAKSHGAIGYVHAADTEPVAIMPTLDHGIKMQMSLWRRPMYNNKTIDLGCQQWATANKGKRGTPYARDLAQAAGASIDTKVADLSDNQLKRMITAQMRWEGFKPGTVSQA